MCLVLDAGFIYRTIWHFVHSATEIENFGKIMHFLESSNTEMANTKCFINEKQKFFDAKTYYHFVFRTIDTCSC